MIEAYVFLAAFAAQILVGSVLQPAWLASYVRAKAQVQFLGWDAEACTRFLGLYRLVNAGLALCGLGLMVWLFETMQRPAWTLVSVIKPLCLYLLAQTVPFLVLSLIGAWGKRKALMRIPPAVRRTVSLERRGLFHFVSPPVVVLAVLAYLLFAAFILKVEQHPVPGFAGYIMLRTITLVYVTNGCCVYWLLYRRRKWPQETQAYRLQAVALQVRMIFHVSIFIVAFVALTATLTLLHLLKWMPVMLSVYFVACMLFISMVISALRRQADADRLASVTAHPA